MSRAPYLLGLTGSIGMGKSTTSQMFADQGCPVWDADAAVHRLYDNGGAAVAAIAGLHPAAIVDSAVDRGALKTWIANDPAALPRIEAVVHPLVTQDRAQFIQTHQDADILVLDIPLLFETGAQDAFDGVVVVSAPPEVQRDRVMARAGMTIEHFQRILDKQMPDAEKRKRADFVIETLSMDAAEQGVRRVIKQILESRANA